MGTHTVSRFDGKWNAAGQQDEIKLRKSEVHRILSLPRV